MSDSLSHECMLLVWLLLVLSVPLLVTFAPPGYEKDPELLMELILPLEDLFLLLLCRCSLLSVLALQDKEMGIEN